MFRTALVVLAGLATAIPTLASADDINDAIKARQGYYQNVSFNAGKLFAMAQGTLPYDAAAATTAATNLKLLSDIDTSALWPQGSSNIDRPGVTRARPEIWSTFPAILDKAQDWKNAIAVMSTQAGGGIDALRANIGALGASCGACHDNFRAKTF